MQSEPPAGCSCKGEEMERDFGCCQGGDHLQPAGTPHSLVEQGSVVCGAWYPGDLVLVLFWYSGLLAEIRPKVFVSNVGERRWRWWLLSGTKVRFIVNGSQKQPWQQTSSIVAIGVTL